MLYMAVQRHYVPVRPAGPPTEVEVYLNVFNLIGIESSRETFTLNADITLVWHDPNLAWDSRRANFTQIYLPAEMVWRPDVGILNSARDVVNKNWVDMFPVKVRCNSNTNRTAIVTWRMSQLFIVRCELKMFYFPFDSQTCSLDVGTLASTLKQIKMTGGRTYKSISVISLSNSSIFTLVGHEIHYPTSTFAGLIQATSAVSFALKMKRLPPYYVFNFIMPCMLLSLVGLMTMCLPCECGEKMTLLICVLVAFTVLQLIISDIVPHSSTIPLLGIYVNLSFILTAASLASTTIVQWMYHKEDTHPLSPRMRYFIFTILGRACRIRRPTPSTSSPEVSEDLELRAHCPSGSMSRRVQTITPGQDTQNKAEGPRKGITRALLSYLGCMMTELHAVRRQTVNADVVGEVKAEWRAASRVVERFFLIFFTCCICLIFIILLLILPYNTQTKNVNAATC